MIESKFYKVQGRQAMLFYQNILLLVYYQLYNNNQMKRILVNLLKVSPITFLVYKYYSLQQRKEELNEGGLRSFKGFKKRDQHIEDISSNPNYDIVVIGGGASGAGVCLDASTRGLRTLVIQKNDFGSGTSSKSTKLIHGGVRYLQQVFSFNFDSISTRIQKFKLVTEAIKQRGVLLRNAAYMNQKIPFIIPCTNMFYSAYYYAGSLVYYLIYFFASQKNTVKFNFPYFLHRNQIRDIFPFISDKYQSAVVYEDGCFNDSRLLLTTLLTSTLSKQQYQNLPSSHVPANILNKAQFIDFIKSEDGKVKGIVFKDNVTQKKYVINAKYVVNCTGTWADKIRLKDNPKAVKRICIVAGSHLTYQSKIASQKFGLCMPSKDGRVILVVPWLNNVIVGTTQKIFQQPETNPKVSPQQRLFLQTQMSELMGKISAHDMINLQKARWSGLRPLVLSQQAKNTKDIARTHVVQRSSSGLYSLMGGKWTTYRKMGQDLVDQISKQELQKNGKKFLQSNSENVLLVGSCSPYLRTRLMKQHGKIGEYLYKTYGSLALQIIKGDLTPVFGNVTKSELDFIIKNQMVNDVQDILLRRLRIAFLNQKRKTLELVPYLSRQIIKEKRKQLSQKDIQNYIKNNIQSICSYEYD